MVRRSYDERNVIAKLIKMYVLYNPYCTARDIAFFLESENFGVSAGLTTTDVAHIIKDFNKQGYAWFDLLRVDKGGNPSKYVVRE